MKESLNRDVAEFFYEKTSGFEKTPPESVWESVSSAIPSNAEVSHFQSFVNHLHLFPVLVSGVMVVTLMYFIKPQFETNTKEIASTTKVVELKNNVEKPANVITEVAENNQIQKTEIAKIEEKPAKIESTKPQNKTVEIAQNSHTITVAKAVPVKYDTIATSSKQISITQNKVEEVINTQKRIYNINASNFKKIEKIHFVKNNKTQDLVKEVIYPKSNPFGFYEIDIIDLQPGTYRVKVLQNSVWVDHKIETFN